MNKAKAIFSGAMILAVAGTSAVCWYLNDQGIIGENKPPVSDSYVEYENDADNNYGYDNVNGSGNKDDVNDKSEEKETTTKDAKPESEIVNEEISDFLTVFSKVYFSENEKYTPENRSSYELIRFAYSHIKRTASESVETVRTDDNIGYYNRVSFESVNEVLEKYLGVTVPRESVYTENDYAFFRYSEGYFMAPAADGLPFKNISVVDHSEIDGDKVNVSFTIYSGDEEYAKGEAVVENSDGKLQLVYYNLEK